MPLAKVDSTNNAAELCFVYIRATFAGPTCIPDDTSRCMARGVLVCAAPPITGRARLLISSSCRCAMGLVAVRDVMVSRAAAAAAAA